VDVSCLIPDARRTALGLLGARSIKPARRLFLILALVSVVVEVVVVLTAADDRPVLGRIAPAVGLVALWVWWRQSCHAQRMPPWRDPVEFALVGAVAITAGAAPSFALLLVGVLFRSLFTGPLRTAFGVAAYWTIYLLASVLGPGHQAVTVADAVQALPLFAIAAGIMCVFGRSLERYDRLSEQLVDTVAERRMAAIVRHSFDVVTVIDEARRIRYQSPAVERVLGYAPAELAGTDVVDLLHPDDREWLGRAFADHRRELGGVPLESRWRHKDGGYRLVQTVANDLLTDPDVHGIVLTTRDVTERRALEDELKHRAFHDSLTGLANRARLDDRLAEELVASRDGVPRPALVLLDLDDFKAVNDSLGHAAGDRLLVAMAARLGELVREPDLVARLGGDEFALLLHAPDEREVAGRVDTVLAALAAPFTVDERALRVGASAGVCLPEDGDGPEEVLRNADLALYRAKEAGKGWQMRFAPEMHDAAVEALELESSLRDALGDGELELHYQPLYTETREIAGLEALLRWRHPERGLLAPAAFLDTAERSGLIVPIGRWVLREACRQGARWSAEHPRLGRIGIGVNVSAEQLREPSLLDDVRRALDESGLPPGRLILEITETVLMQDLELAATTLTRIKALGVSLALDDFGTGYSSLAYLQQLPLDFLKVPRPFVAALGDDERALDLIRGIVQLGASLGLRVVAEGVETEQQLAAVHAIGCGLVQGFLLSRPVPAAGMDALLAARATAVPARAAA
jgi:diguanylate cyclase (GGDEF)-like protein/PAS domain S-box-containing protein